MPLVGVAARFASAARAAMRRAPAGLALAGSSAGTGAVRGAPGSLASGATPGARVGVRGVRFAARSNGWIAAGPVPASAFASASPGAVVGCSERLGGPGSLRPIWLRALHAPSLASRARRYPGEGPSEPIPKPKRISKEDVLVHFARSSGAGGQHVNKTSTKVDMRLPLPQPWLHPAVQAELERKERNRINKEGQLVLSSQRTRSQGENLLDALHKMQTMLDEAWEAAQPIEEDPAKKKRLEATKKKANAERIRDKKQRSEKKQSRRGGWDD